MAGKIAVIMGSESDREKMQSCCEILDEFKIKYDVIVASAHRDPGRVMSFARNAEKKYTLIIAGAGMAAHLPGVIASHTPLPVIGVPIEASPLRGYDALYSIVQMPTGVPVAAVAINGMKNAAILATQILGVKFPAFRNKIKKYKKKLAKR